MPMPNSLDEVLGLLDLEELDPNLFRGRSPQEDQQRVFGGQVLGQAIVAAGRTVETFHLHSLHAYFIRAGDPKVPIIYRVERLRDGRSFGTRRVTAIQHGRSIFALSSSYHKEEPSPEHQTQMPEVPEPETLLTMAERAQLDSEVPRKERVWMENERSIDLRHVDATEYLSYEDKSPENLVWMRANGKVPDDPRIHQAVVAYGSDMTIIDTAFRPHNARLAKRKLVVASLDHAMWFHRPFRADEFLLYAQESPSFSNTRGFCTAKIFTRDGQLAVSVAQEGLIRDIGPVDEAS